MGFLAPFFFWPSASSNNNTNANNDVKTNSNAKPHTTQQSWTLVNRDQGNGTDTTSPTSTEQDSNGHSQSGHGHGHRDPGDGAARNTGLDEEYQTDSKQSWKGSSKFTGIKTRLRSRKRQSISELANTFEKHSPPSVHETADEGQVYHPLEEKEEVLLDNIQRGSHYTDTTEMPQTDQGDGQQVEDSENRKVSDQTHRSLDSEMTSSTVCHYPSRVPSEKIALEDRGYVYEEPFGDVLESSGSRPSTHPKRENTTRSTRTSMSGDRDVTPQGCPKQQKSSLERRRSRPSDDLPRKSTIFRSMSTLSNESTWSAHIDQRETLKAFNEVATQLCLRPVALRQKGKFCYRLSSKWYLTMVFKPNSQMQTQKGSCEDEMG